MDSRWRSRVTLKLICRLLKPDSGSVIVSGTLQGKELAPTRKRVGYAQGILEKIGLGNEYDSMPSNLPGGVRCVILQKP